MLSDLGSSDDDSSNFSSGSGGERLDVDDVDQVIFAETRKKLRRFLAGHPCPSREIVEPWVQAIFMSPEVSESSLDVRETMVSLDCSPKMFDFDALERMWNCGGQDCEKQVLQEVGKALNEKGGMACMRLHFYLLCLALREPSFIKVGQPDAVKQYPRGIEVAWDGIGSWKF